MKLAANRSGCIQLRKTAAPEGAAARSCQVFKCGGQQLRLPFVTSTMRYCATSREIRSQDSGSIRSAGLHSMRPVQRNRRRRNCC